MSLARFTRHDNKRANGRRRERKMNLMRRVKGLILTPDAEWAVIETEEMSIGELYRRYIIYLAAIPPLASFLGVWLFGYSRGALGEAHVTFGAGTISGDHAILRHSANDLSRSLRPFKRRADVRRTHQ